ncbi:MAG: cytochrome c3 family protein [Bryobacteraceae bacterium]
MATISPRAAAVLLALALSAQETPRFLRPPPKQPIPFSHRAHLTLKLECKNCHQMADPGEFAGLPPTGVCMSCHTAIKKDSPAIQRLAEYHNAKGEVPWARVNRIADYVYFSHKEHLARAKATCETCHGPVQRRDVLGREKDITSMAACMDCHRARSASLACDYCHEQR